MEQVAVAWIVLQRTDSAAMVGLAQGARALPSLVLSPLGGVVADRFDRRKVLAVSQATAATIAATMATLDLTGALRLWHIFLLVFAFGMMWSINNPTRHALIPQLVPREDLMNAIALNSTGFNLARSVGPFIGAAMLGTVGFGKTFAITSGFYLVVLMTTLQIRTHAYSSEAQRESVLDNLRHGFQYLKRDRVILTLVLLALFPIAIGFPYIALVPVFARDVLGKSELGFGMMLGFIGFGSFAGTFVLATFSDRNLGGRFLLGLGLVFALSLIAFGLSRSYAFSLLVLFVSGGSSMMYLSYNNTLVQMRVQDDMRGRVMSLLMTQFGLTPLGAVVAGVLAQETSPGATVVAMGVTLAFASVAAMVLVPSMRRIGALNTPSPDRSRCAAAPPPGSGAGSRRRSGRTGPGYR